MRKLWLFWIGLLLLIIAGAVAVAQFGFTPYAAIEFQRLTRPFIGMGFWSFVALYMVYMVLKSLRTYKRWQSRRACKQEYQKLSLWLQTNGLSRENAAECNELRRALRRATIFHRREFPEEDTVLMRMYDHHTDETMDMIRAFE